jgi:hypothetical protein
MKLRMLQYSFALALAAAQLGHADTLAVNGIKGISRSGNSCFSYTGFLTNTCQTNQTVSFAIDPTLTNKFVESSIYTDADQFTLFCFASSLNTMNGQHINYQLQSNQNKTVVGLPLQKVPFDSYQINCEVPPGKKLFGVQITY